VDAFRTGLATLADDPTESPDRTFHSLDEALAEGPDFVVVSNPTSLHIPVATKAVTAGCHVLIEKPISSDVVGCADLAAEAARKNVRVGVAYNMRFHPFLRRLHALASESQELGRPLLARAHVGGYLPDWHPWEDFRKGYAARKDLGGGAALTNSHEIDAVLWLMGCPVASSGVSMGLHPLQMDVDEASCFWIRHESGALSSVTLSLAQRPASRTMEVQFENGRAEADFMGGTLHIHHAGGTVENHPLPADFSFDNVYREQLLSFFRAIAGGRSDVATVDDAINVLEIVNHMEGDNG